MAQEIFNMDEFKLGKQGRIEALAESYAEIKKFMEMEGRASNEKMAEVMQRVREQQVGMSTSELMAATDIFLGEAQPQLTDAGEEPGEVISVDFTSRESSAADEISDLIRRMPSIIARRHRAQREMAEAAGDQARLERLAHIEDVTKTHQLLAEQGVSWVNTPVPNARPDGGLSQLEIKEKEE